MAGRQDFVEFFDDFIGTGAAFPTSADPATPWLIVDTSAAGAPTYVNGVTNEASGAAKLTLAATSEVENICLAFNDILTFDIDDLLSFEARVKIGAATLTSGSSHAFGMQSARNDTHDTIAEQASFRQIGADSTTLVVVESDDGTNDKDDIATGQTLINAFKYFKIDFSNKASVKFYMSETGGRLLRVAKGTTFDMSNYTGKLQPFFQLQKAANTNVDAVVIDYIRVCTKRAT